ncbi:MAG: FAD-dependent oxidoreductase, partial [Candidatus Heimdallarchaeaceae archaeon]
PGQLMIREDVKDSNLNRVVVASCSPLMHEKTFQKTVQEAGLNPYLFQMANIREHVSWVTKDKKEATIKAKRLVAAAVNRVRYHEPLETQSSEVNENTLVVGAGITGIEAALTIANSGKHVYLVEKESSIGGKMAKLDKTFPTLDCSQCILAPKMVEVSQNPNITLLTSSEVTNVSGFIGNFKIEVTQKPTYIDPEKCTACGECSEVCPIELPNAFTENMSTRKAAYRMFPQAIPNSFLIDKLGSAPCNLSCPAKINPMAYVGLISQDRFDEAADIIRRDMPFLSVCSYICFHPCEKACERGNVDQPIAIRDLKRVLHEIVPETIEDIKKAPKSHKEKIAIIGGGPAGLTAAWYLAKLGYPVTVFEKTDKLGGLLRTRVKNLPIEVLDLEIEKILKLGVDVEYNKEFKKDFDFESLKKDGYQAFLIALGREAPKGVSLTGIEVEKDRYVSDPLTYQTKIPSVFVAGDNAIGIRSSVKAIGQGKEAAESIHRMFMNMDLSAGREPLPVVENVSYLDAERKDRISFDFNKGIDIEEIKAKAKEEADRCLKCSACSECMLCVAKCEVEAINHDDHEKIQTLDVGNIIISIGYELFDPSLIKNYGYGVLPNVISSLEFETIVNASGPTGGKILLENGKEPQSVGIIHCVGSRDSNNLEYCSQICCMYSMKFAHLIKERTNAQVYEFYIDLRATGKGYEQFYKKVLDDDVMMIRGKVAEVNMIPLKEEEEGKLLVKVEDTLLGQVRRIPVDLLILSTGGTPAKDTEKIKKLFGLSVTQDGFFLEQHPKLAPIETPNPGIYIAGACSFIKDIPASVAQAQAAASKALAVIGAGKVEMPPINAVVNPDICSGCKTCIGICPYSAITFDNEKKVSIVNPVICKGCGTCVAACPSGALKQNYFTDKQVLSEIEAIIDPERVRQID